MTIEVALAQEKIWFDKFKYEDAERTYYENLAKLQKTEGQPNKKSQISKASNATQAPTQTTNPAPKVLPVAPKTAPTPVITPTPVIAPEPVILTIEPPNNEKPRNNEKRFKAKNRNKSMKESEKKVETIKHEVSSNNHVTKVSLAEEVAKARQHIKSSLECVDGIAKLTTDSLTVEVTNRLNSLETENSRLVKEVKDLTLIVKQLTDRISKLEVSGGGKDAPATSQKPAPAPAKAKVEDDDDGVDLFGSDSEEEDEDAKKIKEQRLAEYAAKKSKKPVLIAKSNIILDVKPWDDETDMKQLEAEVRKITTDGLIWGASKLVPLAYGIHKLQISCVVEDDLVSVDWLQEQIESAEDFVQSVDIAAFNKV